MARGQALVAEEGLFGDAVLTDGDRGGRRSDDDELGKVIERARRNVLELGGHRRAVLRQFVERRVVVVGGRQVAVGDSAGGAVGVGVENPDAITHLVRCGDEETAELAAAEHAESRRREDHRKSREEIVAGRRRSPERRKGRVPGFPCSSERRDLPDGWARSERATLQIGRAVG